MTWDLAEKGRQHVGLADHGPIAPRRPPLDLEDASRSRDGGEGRGPRGTEAGAVAKPGQCVVRKRLLYVYVCGVLTDRAGVLG